RIRIGRRKRTQRVSRRFKLAHDVPRPGIAANADRRVVALQADPPERRGFGIGSENGRNWRSIASLEAERLARSVTAGDTEFQLRRITPTGLHRKPRE